MRVRFLAAWSVAGFILASAAAAAPGPFAAAPRSTRQEKPDDVLARAKQLYAEEGPKPSLPVFERALALYQSSGDRRGEAITLGLIGNCHKRFGDFPKALDFLGRALALKREIGDRLEEGKTLSNLGLVYWEMGDYPTAIDHLTRSIAVGREVDDRQLEGAALNNLSLVYDELGDYKRSLEQYQRVLEIYRGTSFERGESDTLGNIGGVYLLLGQYREALRYYQQSLAISERLKLKASASQDLGNLALCYRGLGQIPQAIDHFDRALPGRGDAGPAVGGNVPFAFAQTISVTAADPPTGAQGTVNLNVIIKGKGFKTGAKARFYRGGTYDPDGIVVNSTTFRGSTELLADITIADWATLTAFDIEVALADGRTGKGAELFSVVAKGPNSLDVPLTVEFADVVSGVPAGWYGDGAAYTSDTGEKYLVVKIDHWPAYEEQPAEGTFSFDVASASKRSVGLDFSRLVVDAAAAWCPEVCPVQPTQPFPDFAADPIQRVRLFDTPQWSPPNYDFLTPAACSSGLEAGICPNDFLLFLYTGRKEYRLRFSPNIWRKLALDNTKPYGVMGVAYEPATDTWTLSPLRSRTIDGVVRQEPCPVSFERKDTVKGRNTWVFLGCYDMPFELTLSKTGAR
jgi:tetratricopeptide (TPR) repeat protein